MQEPKQTIATKSLEQHYAQIEQLYANRSISIGARLGWPAFGLLLLSSWFIGDFSLDDLFSPSRLQNFYRFLSELRPYPLHGKPFEFSVFLQWSSELFQTKGWEATKATLAISVASIVVAGFIALLLAPLATWTVMSREPFIEENRKYQITILGLVRRLIRILFIFLRSVPEYVWAFIFLTVLGPGAWAAILALAVHNIGALGRLVAETMENLPRSPLSALRMLGATRSQIVLSAIYPMTQPRFLLFLFVRWENCVRESTVLGLLGLVSLGYWVQDARARTFYDQMLFFIVLGGLIVFIGDLFSTALRSYLRKR